MTCHRIKFHAMKIFQKQIVVNRGEMVAGWLVAATSICRLMSSVWQLNSSMHRDGCRCVVVAVHCLPLSSFKRTHTYVASVNVKRVCTERENTRWPCNSKIPFSHMAYVCLCACACACVWVSACIGFGVWHTVRSTALQQIHIRFVSKNWWANWILVQRSKAA